MPNQNQSIVRVAISDLNPAHYNPRKWSEEATKQLTESIQKFGLVDPILANSAKNRKNVVIGGHFRLKVAKNLGYKTVPVLYVDIPDENRERELNIRLNKNLGDWDYDLLAEFDESLLSDIGFLSEDLDDIFNDADSTENDSFNLSKELNKLGIQDITARKGDIYQLGDSRLMVGDSTVESDFDKLMNKERADMCLTDPPYILDYLHAKRAGKPVTGFGSKRNRRYLETESLPDNFTELWMANVKKHSSPDFSIICYENWKNMRIIWNEMEKHWSVKNMIIWHLPNRHQGYTSKNKFFSKYDIAMVGGSGEVPYNTDSEEESFQETYETALYGISGKAYWEGYQHGKKATLQPTDFIEFQASDEKHSGQGVIFGTKPLEILIPYIKFLTKRGDLVVEPFCGSGSTLIASVKIGRRCFIMEKSPVYAEVALARWEKETGLTRKLIHREDNAPEVNLEELIEAKHE
jgi:parB domain protein nuclease (fragment)